MTARVAFLFALAVGVLLAAPREARASDTFPQVVQTEWQLPAPPPCTLCHQSEAGGAGTATKLFARSLLMHGAMATNDASLKSALAELKAEGTDSDNDGISDYDELRMGTDPNDGPGYGDVPIPETGCAWVAPRNRAEVPWNGWFLAAIGAFLALRRVRRARP